MQILEQESIRKRNLSVTVDQKLLNNVIKVQKAWRRYQHRKILKKRIKKMKAKKQIATQLLSSERTYCQHLLFIIKDVIKPSKLMIDDEQLHSLLFGNLEKIYHMHENFLVKLEQAMKNYSHHKTCFSSIIYDQLFAKQDFKSNYSNYCANYKKSNKIAKLLFANNSGFNNLLKGVGIQTSNALQSYLIKPMQRLCKYELLLDNYYKNMQPDHPDYTILENTISSVQKLVKETNEQVEQFLLDQKYKDICYQFQQVLKKIPNPNRKLIFSIQDISLIDLINDSSSHFKQLNLFSDSVLLVPMNSCKPIFCLLHILKDLPNLKYFKNLVQLINSDKYLTIQFKKEKQKQNFLQASKKSDISNKNKDFVDVSIPGTQIRQSLFKNYTVYIVQVKFSKDNIRKIYPRFKDLLNVQEVADRKKIKLNLPSLNKQNYLQTTKSKTIQKRKLIIQQFLQKLLNCKECYQYPQIFKILNLTIKESGKKIEQQIQINLPNNQTIKSLIDVKNAATSELKECVSRNLGLTYSSQFQIFEIRNKVRRLVHDDELVNQIYENQKSTFNPFKECISYVYTRHHYLEPDDEFNLYKNDFVRTQLQLSVIKSEILKYRLEEELMITFMCLFALYINLDVQDDSKLSAFIKDITKKQYKVSKQDFRAYYKQVEKKVQSQEDEMVTLPFLIIKIISNSPLYRCQQFEVNVHPKCFKAVKTYIAGLEEKVILGIKPTHVLLLTVEQKHIMQSFPLEHVEVAEIHPTAIVLQINNIGPLLRLNTQNAFEISKLFQIYKGKL